MSYDLHHIHAGPEHALVAGECAWRFHLEDVSLYCDDACLPEKDECVTHFSSAIAALVHRDGIALWAAVPVPPKKETQQ